MFWYTTTMPNFPTSNSWSKVLSSECAKPYFLDIKEAVALAYQSTAVYPPSDQIFRAFELCDFEKMRVVIIGQDPYHNPNQAHGLAFSVPDDIPIPPSLRNIYTEIKNEYPKKNHSSGDLTRLATQGVLLLNSTLTVEAHKAGSHQHIGWENFTDAVIRIISEQKQHVAFMLWGAHAIKKARLIDSTKHLVLTAPHPSPLSVYRGFFGCRHFITCNEYLQKNGYDTIDW